ncbi:MAG: response regulator [Magnetococcales bacterium]|nr:response regulator [Magnetococcales bacterium]
MTLRHRYTLIILGLVISATLVVAGALLMQFRESMHQVTTLSADSVAPMLREQLRQRGELLTRVLADNLVNPVYQYDMETVSELIAAAREREDVLEIVLYDPRGRVVHDGQAEIPSYGKTIDDITPALLALTDLKVLEEPQRMVFFMPVQLAEENLGGVRVAFSLARITGRIDAMREGIGEIKTAGLKGNLIAIALITLLLTGLGIVMAVWVARGLSRPIGKLAKQAEALGQGDLETAITLERQDELGQLAGALDVMRRDLGHSYHEIQRQNEELKALDRMKDDFLANVTHEFKTPLNGILGLGRAMGDGAYGKVPQALDKPITQVVDSADRLLKLTLQILAFSPAGASSGRMEKISIRGWLAHFLETFEYQAREKQISLQYQAPENLTLHTDPDQLETILMNLVGNAVKFTHRGLVRVQAQALGEVGVALSVADTGIGIPKELHDKVFDRFQQGFESERRLYEGSGLGLAIMKRAVGVLQGAVHLESVPKRGSTFTVLLPVGEGVAKEDLLALWPPKPGMPTPVEGPISLVAGPMVLKEAAILQPGELSGDSPDTEAASADPLALEGDPALASASSEPSNPSIHPPSTLLEISPEEEVDWKPLYTILVVDDDPINREVVRANLGRDFHVAEAATGAEGLEKIRARPYDLILLDLMMPGLSGYDVLNAWKKEQATHRIPPVIVLSAKDQIPAITRAFELGAVDYVSKPFHREELRARIYAHVQLRQNAMEIMERKLAESRLRAEKAIAEAADSAKSEFLANMSHEIRTPMNAVIGLTDLALQAEISPKGRDYLTKIAHASHSLLRILNDILDFSKIEAGRLELEQSDFYLRDVFDHLADLFRNQAAEQGVELILSLSDACRYRITGDQLRLEQVLINLTANALKFTEAGEVELGVTTVMASEEGVLLAFFVRDTGMGMSREQMEKLFSPFTQADASTTRKFGGTGLGLAICKRLVEMMGGRIQAESVPREGSIFNFTAHFARQVAGEGPHLTPPEDFAPLNVLVVDRNPATRKVLVEMLGALTFSAHGVDSTEAALAALRREEESPYQLAMVDWFMSDGDGIETALALQSLFSKGGLSGQAPRVVLMLPAHREGEIRHLALESGFSQALVKPVNCSILFDTIMETFGRQLTKLYRSGEKGVDGAGVTERVGGARVLLVEDNPINQQVAREVLENIGLEVELAENGLEAVQMVGMEAYDLVLMDIQMPQMDGYAATRKIRENPKRRNLPIIAMTAHAMHRDREKSLAAGMDAHIAKPIDRKELYGTLMTWIEPGEREIKKRAGDSFSGLGIEQQVPEDLVGVDVPAALNRLGGNHHLFRSLLYEFQRDFANSAEQVRDCLRGRRQDDLLRGANLVHAVKGLAGNLSATDLFLAAQALEVSIREERHETWPGLLADFDMGLSAVIKGIGRMQEAQAKQADEARQAFEGKGRMDRQKVADLMAALLDALEEARLDAQTVFGRLKPLLAGVPDETKGLIAELEACIFRLDFGKGRDLLLQLAEALEITLTGEG